MKLKLAALLRHALISGLLTAIPSQSWAMGPDYGAVTLLFILFLVVAAVMWVLGLLAVAFLGRKTGLYKASRSIKVYMGITLALFMALLAYTQFTASERRREAERTEQAIGKACLLEAGETGQPLAKPATAAIVQLDRRLDAEEGRGLGPIRVGETPPNVMYDNKPFDFPGQSGTVFVRIQAVLRPIEGAGQARIRGNKVDILDATGKLVATRTDILRQPQSWCLGWDQGSAIESFVWRMTGLSIFAPHDRSTWDSLMLPGKAPIGQTSRVETGNFASPPERETRTGLRLPLATLAQPDGVLALLDTQSGAQDSFDLIERDPSGGITGRWRLRFPPVEDADGKPRSLHVGAMQRTGSELRIELLFDLDTSAANPSNWRWRKRAFVSVRLD